MPDSQRNDTFSTLKNVVQKIGLNTPMSYESVIKMLLEKEKFGVSKLLTAIACYIRDNPRNFPQPEAKIIADQLENIVNQNRLTDAP